MHKPPNRRIDRKINRTTTAIVLFIGVLPLLTFAFTQSAERQEVQRALEVAVEDASREYQRLRSLPSLSRRYAADLEQATARVLPLMREKSASRREVASLQNAITERRWRAYVEGESGATLPQEQIPLAQLMRGVLRTASVLRGIGDEGISPAGIVAGTARGFAATTETDLHASATGTGSVSTLETRLADARTELATIQTSTEEALEAERDAAQRLRRTQNQLDRIRQTAEEVHAEVIRMQSALARIDAQIRSRIERELIEKGLLTPGTIDHSIVSAQPTFSWPVYGPTTAGFHDSDYLQYFGIPHNGLDVAAGQGSPVHAAADGIVFFARDGGATGYSYVLVGHQGGYATLYGHLSQIAVSAGQALRQGEFIGLSGGEPGTRGAGPTTTGPHLHFEVLANGTNIDPKGVLP
ncbi:MAG: peptidoglycan DD-metalloendopeptidase family protein [Candidatus Peribacter sp.]|jgi:murein DD-endopeptidase MepM/ murein hydrolase activator NlpD